MELKISGFFNAADPFNYSASAAEMGQGAGAATWHNAKNADFNLLDSEEKRAAFRAFALASGGWDEDEVGAWSHDELNALCIQWVSSEMREPVGFELGPDTTEEQWEEYRRQSEEGIISGLIFKGTDGEIYFYIGS